MTDGKLDFRIRTITEGNTITQTISIVEKLSQKVVDQLTHKAVDMQEEQNIVALKSLGWTPPEGFDK